MAKPERCQRLLCICADQSWLLDAEKVEFFLSHPQLDPFLKYYCYFNTLVWPNVMSWTWLDPYIICMYMQVRKYLVLIDDTHCPCPPIHLSPLHPVLLFDADNNAINFLQPQLVDKYSFFIFVFCVLLVHFNGTSERFTISDILWSIYGSSVLSACLNRATHRGGGRAWSNEPPSLLCVHFPLYTVCLWANIFVRVNRSEECLT